MFSARAVFISTMLMTNVFGVKLAGKFNDFLTITKLIPLVLIVSLGPLFVGSQPQIALSHFQPFFKGEVRNIGQALVLIFWAYAGFELSTLPADEIKQPRRTLPRALFLGMLIVTTFYITTNSVVIGVTDQESLASSPAPLIAAGTNILGFSPILVTIGGLVIGIGALISIMGADESGTLGTSRLALAMSIDGLLPRVFSRLHSSFHTPYIGIALICSTAFVASVFGSLSALINSSVFLLSFTYLATCISAILLEKKHQRTLGARRMFIPTLGIIFSFLLITQVNEQQILI